MQIIRSNEIPTTLTPGDNVISILAATWTGAQQTMVLAQRQGPGGANPLHQKSVEAVVVALEGQVTLVTETDEQVLDQGDVVVIPADTVHSIQNKGSVPARWLTANSADATFATPEGTAIEPGWLRGELTSPDEPVRACHLPA